jgi:SAM-dependent methyltransferase
MVVHQQQVYEHAYRLDGNDYGLPDRNVMRGRSELGARILTLGGGTANDLWFLAKENFIVNVEYAASGLLAAACHGVRGVLTDLNRQPTLPFASNSFDIVVCKDILEHLIDPLAVLKEARRVVRADGQIVISVPNHFYWPMRIRLLLGKGIVWRGLITDHGGAYDEWDYMHIRFFTYNGFRRFINRAGLEPIHFYWDFGNLAYYYNPDRWFEPQLWKRKKGLPLSRRARFGLTFLRPIWLAVNLVFPRPLRQAIVQCFPGFFSGGFYVRCTRK